MFDRTEPLNLNDDNGNPRSLEDLQADPNATLLRHNVMVLFGIGLYIPPTFDYSTPR